MIGANEIIEIIKMKNLVLQNKQLVDKKRKVVEYNGVRELVYAFIDQPQNANTVIKQVKTQLNNVPLKNIPLKNNKQPPRLGSHRSIGNERLENEHFKNEQLENEHLKNDLSKPPEKNIIFHLKKFSPNMSYNSDIYCSASNLLEIKKYILDYHGVSAIMNDSHISFNISFNNENNISNQIEKHKVHFPFTPFLLHYQFDYNPEFYIPIVFRTCINDCAIYYMSFITNDSPFEDVVKLTRKVCSIDKKDSVKITAWTGHDHVHVKCMTDVFAMYNLCTKNGQKYVVLHVN